METVVVNDADFEAVIEHRMQMLIHETVMEKTKIVQQFPNV